MLETKPSAGEFEASIFGPGVGECIVLHLGAGKWMVVDSCLSATTGGPVALEYLGALGVDVQKDVVAVVVTHWHDDHTSGTSDVLRACDSAAFFCSAALGKREFFQLVAGASQLQLKAKQGSGVDEMKLVFDVLKKRRSRSGGRTLTPDYALANTIVFRSASSEPPCVVEALSPSSASVTRGMLSFAPKLLAPKKRLPNPGPNELSMVLHVQFGEVAALLGADLEVGSSDAVGWRAIVRNIRNPSGKATIVKVAHHGSLGADHGAAWDALVLDNAHAAVTPFNSSRLPRPADVERLRARTPHLFHASPRVGKAIKFDPTTERTLQGIKIRERRGTMGHIRFRVGTADVACETFGAAHAFQGGG